MHDCVSQKYLQILIHREDLLVDMVVVLYSAHTEKCVAFNGRDMVAVCECFSSLYPRSFSSFERAMFHAPIPNLTTCTVSTYLKSGLIYMRKRMDKGNS